MDILVTVTHYESAKRIRWQCTQQMIQLAKQHRYEVVVVDTSPEPSIFSTLQELGAQSVQTENISMGHAQRLAFSTAQELATKTYAGESNYFLWLEPEKFDLVRFVPRILRAIKDSRADVVIVRRSYKSWKTYPAFQVETERQLNTAYADCTGLINYDSAFGPVAFNSQALPYFTTMDIRSYDPSLPDVYVQQFAPIVAHHNGLVVSGSEKLPFLYPDAQRREETQIIPQKMRKKREWQLDVISRGYEAVYNRRHETSS